MKKIKVLHIITSLAVAGAEKVLLDLCVHSDKEHFEYYVAGLNDWDYLLEDFKKHTTHSESLGMGKDISSFFKALKKLDHIIKEHDIDIIHAHMQHPLLMANILKIKHPDIKIVHTSHNENLGSKFWELFTGKLKRFRDADVIFSKDMRSEFYLDDAYIIPNGISIEKYNVNVEKNEKFTFLSIGILREQKNQKFLINNAQKLIDDGLDFEIYIVGNGPLEDELKSLIKANNMQDHIKMLGLRDDIPLLLNQAHALVMPSHFEGLPITILEAGAAKLPIITTDVGVIRSVVKDDGYIVDIDGFINSMKSVYENYKEAENKSENLYKNIVQNYSIESMARSHEEIYKGLCS
jgi:glycosyltransferase involved in cell wall biosynthesis